MNHGIVSRMKRSKRKSTVSFALVAGLLVLLLLINLVVGLLPAKVSTFDISGTGLTNISLETEKFISSMKEDVTIYWLCADGAVNQRFELMLTRYEEAGSHITVEVIDTTANPQFAAQFTDATLSDGSMIVASGRRATTVEYTDLYYVVNEFINQNLGGGSNIPLTTSEFDQYRTQIAQYYGEDIANYATSYYFKGEAKITAALDYVTRELIPHPYLLTGFGSTAPSETLAGLIESMGMDVEELDLSVAQAIPADANCLILFSPERDLTDREAALVGNYLNAGGSMMLNTAPDVVGGFTNLQSVCGIFGLSAAPGLVEEGDTSYISGSRFTLVPTVSTEHTATAYVSQNGFKAHMPNSHAISSAATLPAGVTVTPLMTTSATATRVDTADTSVTLGTAGKHHVAMAATKSIARENGAAVNAQLTWYGSADAMTDTLASNTSGGNYYYYAATLSLMCEPFVSVYENLAASLMPVDTLSGLSVEMAFILSGLIVVVLPAALLTTGIVIWVRRKKR